MHSKPIRGNNSHAGSRMSDLLLFGKKPKTHGEFVAIGGKIILCESIRTVGWGEGISSAVSREDLTILQDSDNLFSRVCLKQRGCDLPSCL